MQDKIKTVSHRLKAIRSRTENLLDEGEDGRVLVKYISAEVDALLTDLWKSVISDRDVGADIDVVAVGGYGRAELCPYSDWDILFLVKDEKNKGIQDVIEKFLYFVWDCNLPLGYAVRTVKESKRHCKEDINAETAFLESRLLYGEGHLYEALKSFSHESWRAKERLKFCKNKIDELRSRRKKAGDTPFLMEPNIKEGQGGLRDVSTIFWLSMAWYGVPTARHLIDKGIVDGEEFKTFIRSRNFLLKVRSALHLHAGREQDILRFDDQVLIANRFSYEDTRGRRAVESFMKDYFSCARNISDLSDLLILHFVESMSSEKTKKHQAIEYGLSVYGNSLTIDDKDEFLKDPLNLMRVFVESQRAHRYLDSHAMRFLRTHAEIVDENIREDKEAGVLFLKILRSPRNVAKALMQMHETGILGQYIPDFKRVVGHGQFDRYHVYTVDAHTIRAIDVSRDMLMEEKKFIVFPEASRTMQGIARPDILYLALLFHDIAKGRGGDHSVLGESIAYDECKRFGLSEDVSCFVAWLVRNHLLMSKTSQRYDLSDPEVIDDFAHKVEDLEHLDLLFLLTIADMTAVGPGVWTSWKEQLLLELYRATCNYLQLGQVHTEGRRSRAENRKKEVLDSFGENEKEAVSGVLDIMPVSSLLHFIPAQLTCLCQNMARFSVGVSYDVDQSGKFTRFYVWAKDNKGLFSHLVAALSFLKVHVLTAQAFNLTDGRVMDEFVLVNMQQQAVTEELDLEKIKNRLLDVVYGKSPEMPSETESSNIDIMARDLPVIVRQLDKASSHVTVIQVSAAGRPGLLARLALSIRQCQLDMKGANINSFGEKVIDVFFVTEANGEKLTAERVEHVMRSLEKAAKIG